MATCQLPTGGTLPTRKNRTEAQIPRASPRIKSIGQQDEGEPHVLLDEGEQGRPSGSSPHGGWDQAEPVLYSTDHSSVPCVAGPVLEHPLPIFRIHTPLSVFGHFSMRTFRVENAGRERLRLMTSTAGGNSVESQGFC